MKHMIHGPCGDWCLVDGRCSKHFPKPFLEETRMNENAYPYYRRRNNGRNFERPGHDIAAITIEPVTENVIIDHDEIHNYIEARYVGPVEAIWRILVKGATSFNDLKTVNGEFCQSFSAACLALGLVEDDDEWKRAMNEAVAWMMPRQLRHRKAYKQIGAMLATKGKSFTDFPQMEQIIVNNEDEDYLTLEQAMEIGGSGKTFIYTTIYHLARIRNKHVCTMAFKGIAATLLPTGKTVHKTFGLPVPLFADSSSAIKIQTKEAQYLKETDIFIWDEAPMAPRYALEIMDRTLRDIMNNDFPFGGKIVLLSGDFRQLLPIKLRATRSEIVNLSIKFSLVWKNFIKFSLTQNMRVLREEIEFAKFLLDMGDGKLNDLNDNIEIPECCVAPINVDIVEDIYGDLIRKKEFDKVAKCAILSARNVDVDEINKKVVELFDTANERICTSIDSAINSGNGDISEALLPEYLNSLSPSSLPPHKLRLKPNCIIMLIRNLSINEGLCNGTRLIIIELGDHLLKCKILTGDKAGDIVFLNRITLYCENIYPFTFSRRQFPIKLAFAMTINKSQGQTFDKIGLDLCKDVFNHGQLYVAFSRVRSWQSLRVYLGNQRNNRFFKRIADRNVTFIVKRWPVIRPYEKHLAKWDFHPIYSFPLQDHMVIPDIDLKSDNMALLCNNPNNAFINLIAFNGPSNDEIAIFTDGSCTELDGRGYLLNSWSSSFAAESVAILKAIEIAEVNNWRNICTDSLSNLDILGSSPEVYKNTIKKFNPSLEAIKSKITS
ncbi:ATP-dependent DNA helicase PIF1-like [Monomorium pharaonis]|uniref:ATP-dependent DNA helicase PIF1-like n=1 Tax=Monomorium pharaonis TaxID=307658 RepID=UPI001747BF52|nr:ATP-dependent DNA helicase PIF1-like [Monomorium pharaonis]